MNKANTAHDSGNSEQRGSDGQQKRKNKRIDSSGRCDYVVTQRVLSAQLRKGGYEVITACSGQEALAIRPSVIFDLAIIDVVMPEMDGITLLGKIYAKSAVKPDCLSLC